MNVEVIDAPHAGRYEARVDGEVAGFVEYRRRPDAVMLVHTEVSGAYEGEGVGSALARGVLDEVRARGWAVVPLCPFVSAYIRRHREYLDLVAPEHRADLDSPGDG